MNKKIEKDINRIYLEVFNKIYNGSTLDRLRKGDRTAIFRAAEILSSSTQYNRFAEKFGKELAKKGLQREVGIWRKYYKAAQKLGYISIQKSWQQFEMEQLAKITRHNFEMIKSIPNETLKIMEHKYTSTLIEEVAKGNLTRGAFRRQLESHGHKNAKLIARTETAKLQTAITESRAKDIGSVAYIWLSSRDKRTRESHRKMNGVVVFWREGTEKPLLDNMYGNAGEFPNCRCSPEPIFDENDLTASNYKVYNYHNHTIVNRSKKDLIYALEKGEL